MKLLVTAFGPFGGRTRNASSLALAGLKQRLPWLNTRILPVDSIVAPLRMSRALREVAPDAVLMLGEAGGSKAIRLETMAWNERNFRIPDIAGRQPQGGLIDPSAAPSIACTLPFEEIHACLLEFGHACGFSSDPGRYLCNQILFHTLRVMEKRHPHAKAGFIHLPLENDYPTPRVVDALARAIHVVVRYFLLASHTPECNETTTLGNRMRSLRSSGSVGGRRPAFGSGGPIPDAVSEAMGQAMVELLKQ